jgi:glutamate/tyrosine decarboxylase-like PLP-dependent enzyme
LYAPEVAPLIPAGAVIILKQWYDNTTDNPNNPDADMWVMGGSRTGDEMTHAWLAITHLDEKGYNKLLEERNEKDTGDD